MANEVDLMGNIYQDSKVIGIRLRWDHENEKIAMEFLERMQYHEGMNAREVIVRALNWYEKHLARGMDQQEQILAELKAIRNVLESSPQDVTQKLEAKESWPEQVAAR